MKRILSFFLAGILGGLVTLGGFAVLEKNNQHSPEPANFAQVVKQVNINPRANSMPFDFKTAAERAMPAVVHISAAQSRTSASRENRDNESNPFRYFFGEDFFPGDQFNMPKQGTGSGVIYSTDGYIITNNHVVEFADEISVTLYDNRKFNATIVGTDKRTDLAVLKIEGNGLSTLDLGDSDNANVGEWVLAVGNPFDLTSTVTAGIISAKGRSLNLLGGGSSIESFIQTDAAVNPGNSGGALVDAEGNLLGINTAIATRTGTFSGYSFAIPVNLMKRIVDDIVEYGSFKRAFLGVNIYELNSDNAKDLGVKINQGVVIDQLVDGGAAQYSGIQPKDIIVQVDGKEVKSVPELQEAIGRAKVGDVIDLTINRRGDTIEIPVRLKPEK